MLRFNPNLQVERFDDQTAIVTDPETGMMHTLNANALLIFDSCTGRNVECLFTDYREAAMCCDFGNMSKIEIQELIKNDFCTTLQNMIHLNLVIDRD